MDEQWLKMPVLEQKWPNEQGLSLQEAAVRLGWGEALSDLFAQWRGLMALRKAAAPLVGVVGQLNAGKSSLVRSFLSDQGARRVLCGIGEQKGTQRFVFWLPERWLREAEVREALEGELESVFGASHELLSDDPQEAHCQYNNGEGGLFSTPLVAFDPRLDDLGFGLLDCPDVQRGHAMADSQGVLAADWLETDRIRQEFVARASRLMSAVVVIAGRSSVADSRFGFFLGQEPGLRDKPRFLLLNGVRHAAEPVETLLEDAAVRGAMQGLDVDSLFVAYDYELDGVQEKIPIIAASEAIRKVPVFFQVADAPEANQAGAVGEDRLLRCRLTALVPQDLWRERKAERARALSQGVSDLRRGLSDEVARRTENIREARARVMEFLRKTWAPEGTLRFPFTDQIGEQLAAAVRDAAPAYARPTIWASEKVRSLQGGSWRALQWTARTCRDIAHPSQAAKARVREAASRFESSKGAQRIDAELLAKESRRHLSGSLPESVDRNRLIELWNSVLRDVNNLEVVLPSHELSMFGVKFWEEVTVWKKMSLVAMGPVLLLGSVIAACTAPIDLGGSAVILAASSAELLAALGIGVAGARMAGSILDAMLQRHVAVPMYTRLVGATLDAFQLPRRLDQMDVQHFDNLGEVRLDLKPDVPDGPTFLPLVANPFLAEELPEGWENIFQALRQPEGKTACCA